MDFEHAVPLTIEGSSLLHQMLRVRWREWRALEPGRRARILDQARALLEPMEQPGIEQTGLFSMLGHKADLMLVHFRRDFAHLNAVELCLKKLELWDYLEVTASYVSIVELGLYESTGKTYSTLLEQGLEPGTPEWNKQIGAVLDRQREAMAPRLFPEIPRGRYICFYPMDRRRGEDVNWYRVPLADRQRLMHDHGMIGRRYAGEVKQIISGSIGFDDWEWGVDLFAEDPLVFKKLIYEMRFDEVSAIYALFGTFYVGLRTPVAELATLLAA
jgi:hydrogen peroxide-dependent heme synthase